MVISALATEADVADGLLGGVAVERESGGGRESTAVDEGMRVDDSGALLKGLDPRAAWRCRATETTMRWPGPTSEPPREPVERPAS